MERGIIETDPRHTSRRIKTAIQGNVIRALVELITNADDSYIRLEDENKPHNGLIEIVYKKDGHCGIFAVRDHAEGMSIDDVRNGFKKYGAATSGLTTGKRVRGYFGQGAKDALASMVDGKICTFKDDKYTECRIFIEDNKPMYEIIDTFQCMTGLRNIHGIDRNGTVAYFKADPKRSIKVPQLNTVHEELANNFLLRKIMTNPKRKVMVVDNEGITRQLRYQMPKGKEILSEDFFVTYSDFGDFPVHISIWRAERELTQTGDDRHGGLLLVDDEDSVLGISLFRYDHEPLAARFFGEVRIGRFRVLLEKEEAVLGEERDGLVTRHPFCEMLITEIEKRIEKQVREEKIRKQKEAQSKIDSEEATRYRKACSILNKIAEVEVQDVTNLGQNPTDKLEEPPDGFCLYPPSAQITVSKRYAFELRINRNIVRCGSIIKVICTNQKIRVLTPEIHIETEENDDIISKYITVEGTEPNIDGKLRATTGSKLSESKIYVIAQKDLLLSEGMVFQPESITLRPNQTRKTYLLVHIRMIGGGSRVIIFSDNDSIHISKNEIIVNEADAIRHVAKYELEVWGEGADQDAIITAQYERYMALLGVNVRSKELEEEKGHKGMFREPEFDFEPNPLQRTSYSENTGKVIIYVNFPSVQHYLGEDCRYRKALPAQVLIADLFAERCFYEIAKRKVESSGVTIKAEGKQDRIQRDAFDLSRKYGKEVHKILVDQNLLKEAKDKIG